MEIDGRKYSDDGGTRHSPDLILKDCVSADVGLGTAGDMKL